jgi:hypothetical protein
MGLLDKTNPAATRRSVLRHALIGSIITPLFFLVLGKPALREHAAVFFPLFSLLGAGVAALYEWQVAEEPRPKTG